MKNPSVSLLNHIRNPSVVLLNWIAIYGIKIRQKNQNLREYYKTYIVSINGLYIEKIDNSKY